MSPLKLLARASASDVMPHSSLPSFYTDLEKPLGGIHYILCVCVALWMSLYKVFYVLAVPVFFRKQYGTYSERNVALL